MSKPFYITTAIDYANGTPHIGHAYEKVLTDVIARFRRLMGQDVYFLTGLDEHGQKVQQSARKKGVEPQAFCDEVAGVFQGLCSKLTISNDDYIRTTEERHKKIVRETLQKLFDQGLIYKAEYTGYYSARAEQFLQEKDQVDGEWPEIYGEVTEITESNYFFKLAQYQDWLVNHIKTNESFIYPRYRAKQVLEFLKEPLNDLCISRPKERLEWGIPLPFDEDFVTYVWFDALLNYYSAAGENHSAWPADFHVIGKDILVPPHAVYWPIMLHASGIELPKSLLVHGWWQVRGEKMSKTTGNVVDPLAVADQFGADAFRYFLIREMNVGQDSDFSEELFMTRYNAELANDLGNLVSRLLNMGTRYTEQKVPAATVSEEPEQKVAALWQETYKQVIENYNEFLYHKGLESTFAFISELNSYIDLRAPWKLAKSDAPEDRAKLETSLATIAEGLRVASVMLAAVMPSISEKILGLIGQPAATAWTDDILQWNVAGIEGSELGEKTILFPKPEKK